MRKLSVTFMNELKSGVLNPILQLVQIDSTLCMEIRENYINIYYRGGNLLGIKLVGNSFSAHFDKKYFSDINLNYPVGLPNKFCNKDDVTRWIENVPLLKHTMDL